MADYVVSAELELFINDFKKNITAAQNSLQNFEKQVKSVSESTKNGFDGKSISNFSSKLESLGSKINKGTSAWGLDLGKFYDKGSSIFKSFGVDVDKFAGHFGMSGKLMSAIVACFRALIKLGQEMDEARAEIVKGTGAIGDALDSLELSSKQALIRGVGTSVKETGKLIADLNTRFDMTGKVLEDTAVEFGKFIKVNGVDMSNAVNNIADVMARWNVSTNQTKNLMNQLTKASQMSGASVDELVSSVNSGSVYMEQFGFSLTESIAILGSFRKNGIQASTVLTGMRTALAKFSSEGKNAKEAFAEVSTQIKEAATDTEAMQIAVDTFGQRSAPEMVKAIRSGSMSVDEFSDALRNAGQSLDNTYDAVRTSKDAMTDLKNSFKGTFGGIGEGFSAWWKRILNGITEFIRFIEPIVTPIAEVFRSVMTKISEAITYVVRHIRQFVQENSVRWKAFVDVLNRVGQAVKRICGDIVDIFKHVFGLIFSLLGGKWEEATLHAKIIGLKFVRVIQTILDFVINLFVKAINKIGDLINKGWVNWYMFTTDLYKNTGGIVDITGSGKHFSDAKKKFEEEFKGWANKDEMVKQGMELYIKKVMEDSGTRFKDLEEVHLEDNKFGKENKSVNERIEEAEKRLAELEGKGDYIGDLGDVNLTFQEQSLDAIGGAGAEKKESTEWQKKRLQQQLDDITKLKEEQLEAMREEGAAQAELDAVNSTYAQKQIEVYEKIQALKKAGDLEALESVKNAEDEKLQLEEYYAKESEDYRISVETNTVKAIEKIDEESTEWKQKLLNQEIDAIETARTEAVALAQKEGKTVAEIQEMQRKSIDEQVAKYKELSDLKKKDDLEAAKNAQETAEIEKYYATDLAEYIKKLNGSILEDVEEKTESWWSKFTSIMGKIGGIVKNVMGKVVSIVKKGFSMAWEVMQLNPSDVIDNFLKIADTIQTFFIETLPQLPALVDSLLNVIDVLVDTITQPQVIDMLAKTVEEIIIKTVDWLTKNIGKILSGLGKIIGALIKGLGKAISEIDWVELFGEIVVGLWQALTAILAGVWEAIKNIGKAIGEWFTSTFSRKNKSTESHIAKGVLGFLTGGISLFFTGFATGTNNAPKGLALVGEEGPELIDFRGGERVYNATETRDIMSSNGGSSVNNWNVTFNNLNDTSAYTMMRQMKKWQRELAINRVM